MNVMKQFIQLLCFLAIFACESEKTANPPLISTKDQAKLKKLKEVLWPKAYHNQDTVLLNQILDKSFQMISADGGWFTKKDELEWIKNHRSKPDSFYYEIKRLDIYENGTAIISGTGHVFNDGSKMTYQSSNVLIKKPEGWQAINSHVSGIKKH